MNDLKIENIQSHVQDIIYVMKEFNNHKPLLRGEAFKENFLLVLIHCYIELLEDIIKEKKFINNNSDYTKKMPGLRKKIDLLKKLSFHHSTIRNVQMN